MNSDKSYRSRPSAPHPGGRFIQRWVGCITVRLAQPPGCSEYGKLNSGTCYVLQKLNLHRLLSSVHQGRIDGGSQPPQISGAIQQVHSNPQAHNLCKGTLVQDVAGFQMMRCCAIMPEKRF